MIDNFDAGSPPGTNGWESNTGEGSDMRMSCAPAGEIAFSGKQSLKMDFNVSANSWATCTVFFDSVQNWSSGEGVSFYLQASKSGLVFDVDLYAGSMDSQETYAYTIETSPESTTGWMAVDLPWEQFHRVEWEENGGAVFGKPDKMLGFGFGFGTPTDAPNTGVVSVDELRLMGTGGQMEQTAPTAAEQSTSPLLPTNPPPAATPAEQASNPLRRLVCGNAAALPVMALAVFWWSRRRKTGI
jgi:hypothetical protein